VQTSEPVQTGVLAQQGLPTVPQGTQLLLGSQTRLATQAGTVAQQCWPSWPQGP
jgi:hypothetical protein